MGVTFVGMIFDAMYYPRGVRYSTLFLTTRLQVVRHTYLSDLPIFPPQQSRPAKSEISCE
ncbi:hypothetical protein HETIRDRAFT_321942 [Heterobasidion irregulare TC 32-1]|uniref:Uncharacterized protein n=1 Tax=Heterobasidion irregulare (strain TC 32-1) TaxID=747525 RepID=W4K1N1_HETIT|nr:uncharacterized protein HETIRDRAFT_321942 [Heterobasidion irregulare TC 32-1]ETW79629.1 hypothetical protein HETIRDRAFT_321942 [Heterobasidion irregulare TC 32-1]